MGYIFQRLRSLFRYDLDTYFLMTDDLQNNDYPEITHISTGKGAVEFRIIDNIRACESLASLCLNGGYFGDNVQAVIERLQYFFRSGLRCAVAVRAGECVGMSWLTYRPGSPWPAFARFPRLSSHQALLHQSYVAPDARGSGVQRYMDNCRKAFLKSEGFETSLVCIGAKNFASIHNLMATNTRYKLFYHLSFDIPVMGKVNLYPKWNEEPWLSCETNSRRWSPEMLTSKGSEKG